MPQYVIIICLILTLVAGLLCAMTERLMQAALALAGLSVLTSIILFLFGAPWAALFELSLCTGLVTVVLAVAVNLTRPDAPEPETAPASARRLNVLPLMLIFVGVMLLIVMTVTGFTLDPIAAPTVAADAFRDVFWGSRQADILAQIILILVGAFSVVILFKESDRL
ncbi:MAG: hypothetical protein IKD93_05540 [Firmicutes bacterium]|nr:hypothetical protein [Bacillota bacterium]